MLEASSLQELGVLLVEPSAMQAKLINGQLIKQGIAHVHTVDTAQAAMEAIRREMPSLVISALYLPDKSGVELLYDIRNDADHAGLPFILVSSETRPQVLEPVRQYGVCGILPKPFSEQQLGAALNATLDLLSRDSRLEQADVELESVRVLLVDDSAMARKHIRRVLETMGIENFLEAADGVEAVRLLNDNMVDFVITDYNMPEMDGRALVEYIRSQSWQNSVPILMVTSEANNERLAGIEEFGIVGICDKPFEPGTVKQLLANLLKNH
jgi:two-component system chemotaxis response regulator CheY